MTTVLSVLALLLMGWPLAAAAGPPTTRAAAVVGSTGVFAIDNDHHTVVFIPAAGGTPRPVTTGLTNPHGVVRTIRTAMAPLTDIAVDDNNWLFVLDGSTIVKYSPIDGSAPISVSTAAGGGTLTVDAVGNASVTGSNPDDYLETVITTYPVRGGRPIVRKLVADYNPDQRYFNGPHRVVEARDGTIYLETYESGGSGATDVYRVPPGPAGNAVAHDATPRYSEYAFNVDSSSNFYLLQNRLWCPAPNRDEGDCVDDYGVDFVQRYAPSGTGRIDTAVTAVDLPVGGISVASSGAVYGAVLVSRDARDTNSTAVPRMLRINPIGGAAVVLAKGHFSMPVAENFLWYAA